MSKHYSVQIYYEDVDAGGIVYHSKYLNFCERSRSNLFFERGLSPIDGGFHFVVKHIDADFISSAKFGDIIYVVNTLGKVRKTSFILEQKIYNQKDNRLLFSMNVQLVHLYKDKISRIPEALLTLFNT